MQEVTFKFDFDNVIISNDFLDYFLSLKGIKDINYKNDDYLEITIQYTDDISLERIKLELELYFNVLKIPEMLSFDKHIKKDLKKEQIVIKDMCCEYCIKGTIEDLFDTNGIVSAYTNYDPLVDSCYDITFYITYDDTIITQEEINNILENM